MMAITTSNSMRVNPLKRFNESFDSMAYQGIMGFTPYMRRSMEKPDKEN